MRDFKFLEKVIKYHVLIITVALFVGCQQSVPIEEPTLTPNQIDLTALELPSE